MAKRKYFKNNYVDVLKILTPKVYIKDDLDLGTVSLDANAALINSHILSSKYITYTDREGQIQGLHVSATDNLPGIDNYEGISKYFVKQNSLTNITPRFFDNAILAPLKTNLINYKSKDDFATYVSGTLLPSIHPHTDLLENTASAFANNNKDTHNYLVSSLTWLYFLNTSGPVYQNDVGEDVNGFAPSSLVFSALVDQIYEGKNITIDYAIKMYQEYLWRNYNSLSSVDANIIPKNFVSSIGTFTSGTQNLEKLKTLIDIEYSPLYADKDNTKVKDAFESFILLNSLSEEYEETGPLHQMLKAVGYSLFDINDEVEGLNLLASIETCPHEYLPFLGDLIGWKLYGNDDESWRRQLRSAVSLYKKKGTKQGLVDAINTIIPNNPVDPERSITEFYESYVPNLIFYLLKTNSPLFESLSTWTDVKAQSLNINEYSSSDLDLNIRYVVDEIMKRCVTEFPKLFRIGKEPFRVHIKEDGRAWFQDCDFPSDGLGDVHQMPDGRWMTGSTHAGICSNCESSTEEECIEAGGTWRQTEYLSNLGDPAFVFNFRGRPYPIPPWDDERYYKETAITENLLSFIGSELVCLGVPSINVEYLKKYILDNTTRVSSKSKSHESGFLFLTSSLEFPPNYEEILKNHDREQYDYLSMWSGKSSIFNFEVCAGNFDVVYLTDSRFSKKDVTTSLKIIDDFSPAKTKPQVDFALRHVDHLSSVGNTTVSYRVNLHDNHLSGALAGSEGSGVNLRGIGMRGQDFHSGFDDSRGHHIHDTLPVFKRGQVDSLAETAVDVSAIGSFSAINISRKALRRRNFKNTVFREAGGWHSRKGDNMPTYYNTSTSIPSETFSYTVLGFVPSSLNFQPITDYNNLPTVYASIEDINSVNTHFNVDTSNAYPVRGEESIFDLSSSDNYILRDGLLDIAKVLHSLTERMETEKAKIEVEENSNFFEASSGWCNVIESLKNQKDYLGTNFKEFFDRRLDQREANKYLNQCYFNTGGRNRGTGIHSLYKDFISYFYSKGLGGGLVGSRKTGGKNLLSHIYGPLYYNGNLSVDGSAIATSSLLQASSFDTQYELNLSRDYATSNLSEVGVLEFSNDKDLYVGKSEYRTNHVVSGVDLIDTSSIANSSKNWFSVIKLDPLLARPQFDGYFVGNPIILSKSRSHGLPRLRFSLSSTDSVTNLLVPEHYFDLNIKCVPFSDDTTEIGGSKVGVWIHTDVENDVNNNKVFWNYMPDGNWQMQDASSVTSSSVGRTNVLNNFAHTYYFDTSTVPGEEVTTTYCSEGTSVETTIDLPTLQLIQEANIQNLNLQFNTLNQQVKNNINYFSTDTNGKQVHRENQNYIVEVFLYPEESKTLLFDALSLVDRTQRDRAAIAEDFVIPDFSNYCGEDCDEGDPDVSAVFYKSDGSKLAGSTESFDYLWSQIPSILKYSYPDINYYESSQDNYGVEGDWEFKRGTPDLNYTAIGPACDFCEDVPVGNNATTHHHLLNPQGRFYGNTAGEAGQQLDFFGMRNRTFFFNGWSPALLLRQAEISNPKTAIGFKTYVSHSEDRPVTFNSTVDVSRIFPVTILEHDDDRFFINDADAPSWLPGASNPRFGGDQRWNPAERDTFWKDDFGHEDSKRLLETVAKTSDGNLNISTMYGNSQSGQKTWSDEVFDPTGTYFNAATRFFYDNAPENRNTIINLGKVQAAAGNVPPNSIVQDISVNELEDNTNYVFSIYFKPGTQAFESGSAGYGTSSTVTNPDTGEVLESFSTFLVKMQYLRPTHWSSWYEYNPSGAADFQPTNPNTGVVNEVATAHWDAATSLPYATLRFTPGTGTSSVQVNNTGLVESTKLEDAGNGWWRASVALRWRPDWMNKSEVYNTTTNSEYWDDKERLMPPTGEGGDYSLGWRATNGLRVTLQCDKAYSYLWNEGGDFGNPGMPYVEFPHTARWNTWGSLFHKGDVTEVKDFAFLGEEYEGADLLVGDTSQTITYDRELCYLDSSGNVFTGDEKVSDLSGVGKWGNIQKLTTVVRNKVGLAAPVYNLNTQVSAMDHTGVDFSGGYFYIDETGKARDLDGSALTSITDKTYGSLIEDPRTARVEIQEQELLVILRYFNSLTNGFAARRSESVSGIMDLSGGGRLNYRTHPYQMQGQISTQAANYDQITRLDITN